jgi:hypothetical protein
MHNVKWSMTPIGELRNAYKCLVGKSEWKKQLKAPVYYSSVRLLFFFRM